MKNYRHISLIWGFVGALSIGNAALYAIKGNIDAVLPWILGVCSSFTIVMLNEYNRMNERD